MDVFLWQQLSEVKSGMLEIASSLSDDQHADHDKAATKLLELSMKIHELENSCLGQDK